MTVHEQFGEDLALYALGMLQGDQRRALETHLESCANCRRELELLRGDASLLALSTAGPMPPARARQRLLDSIAREPRRVNVVPPARRWWIFVPSLAAAALALVLVVFWLQNAALRQQMSQLQNEFSRQQIALQHAQEVVSTLTATDALRVTLVPAKSPPQPQGRAIYQQDRGSLIFMASNMPPLPPKKAYELWLIPPKGKPIPAGLFTPDAHGSATVMNPPMPPGTEAKAFAVTVEPEQGSSAPTTPIIMVGQGE